MKTDRVESSLNCLSEVAYALFYLAEISPEGGELLKLLAQRLETEVEKLDKDLTI